MLRAWCGVCLGAAVAAVVESSPARRGQDRAGSALPCLGYELRALVRVLPLLLVLSVVSPLCSESCIPGYSL